MTYPWAAGEVLTAADLNAYAGLVLVKTQTIGTAVSSVTVSSAFSSTFANYMITVNGGTGSGTALLRCQLGSTTTGYNMAGYSVGYDGVAVVDARQNQATFPYVGIQRTGFAICVFDLFGPNLAQNTFLRGTYMDSSNMVPFGGYLNNSTQYTAFTISPASGTMTGGTIRVYGYNNG